MSYSKQRLYQNQLTNSHSSAPQMRVQLTKFQLESSRPDFGSRFGWPNFGCASPQRAHDREKLGFFATTAIFLPIQTILHPDNVGQPHVSPHPPPPRHPRPQIVTSTPQQLLVQPQSILVRQPIPHPQQVCFAKDGTLSTPFRSGRCDKGRT